MRIRRMPVAELGVTSFCLNAVLKTVTEREWTVVLHTSETNRSMRFFVQLKKH